MTRNCIFPQTVKPGAYKKRWRARDGRSEQRPYEKRRAEKGAPIKNIGSDTGHRTPKGGGAENARPFEAQANQAAPLRETRALLKPAPTWNGGGRETGAPIKRIGVQKTHKQRPYKGPGPTYDIGEKKLCRNRKKRIHGGGIDLFVWMEAWERKRVLI